MYGHTDALVTANAPVKTARKTQTDMMWKQQSLTEEEDQIMMYDIDD